MLRRAFTALETLLVVGALGISATLAVPMYRQYILRNDLEIARQNVSQAIERAKFLSQVAMNDSAWGFSTDAVPGRGVIFMGVSFATRNAAFDEMYILPSTVSIAGVTEVSFSKIEGLPSEQGIITLTSASGERRTVNISIGSDGTVTIPEDWLMICTDPYGSNPASVRVPDSLWTYYSQHGAFVGECGSGGPDCGNGFEEVGEECDPGQETSSCNSDCTDHACGDGTLNATADEQCDDGNAVNGDGCDSSCRSEVCGNAVVQSGEECDAGAETISCNSDCTAASCGDGTLNATAGEECDDGGESASCNSDCTDHACGDGNINTTAGEECDDGNVTNGDGCDSSCETEPACGNGSIQPGEQCDDDNTSNGDGCDSSCRSEVCGNSVTQSGEQCDGGGQTMSCDIDCTNVSCGDGTLNATAGEECDDGNASNNDGCSSVCQTESCGDSVVQSGEQCDDGNVTNGDGCSSACITEGGGNGVTFVIQDKGVVPDQNYTCEITVLGAALSNGSYDLPITLQVLENGTWVNPFGDWSLPVGSNLNAGQTYVADCDNESINAGTAVHIRARSWDKVRNWYTGSSNGHWSEFLRVSTADDSPLVEVLQNGDAVPSYPPLNNQATIEDFLQNYINTETSEMEMDPNQVIYLFELGTTSITSSSADFQDLVVLLELEAR